MPARLTLLAFVAFGLFATTAAVGFVAVASSAAGGPAPTVSTIAPTNGAPGTLVTVTGTGLSGSTVVAMGGTQVPPTALATGDGISFRVPKGLSPGPASLEFTDPGTATTTSSFTVLAPLQLSPATLPPEETGQPFLLQLAATGGAKPYVFAAEGALPVGVAISKGGLLSGAPAVVGTTTFTVTVTDAHALTSSEPLTLVAVAGPAVLTTSLPAGTVGSGYLATLAAAGGVPPYAWTIASGAMAAGLLLTSNGVLSGRPDVAGTARLAVRVTDAHGAFATATVTVAFAPPPAPPQSLVVATAGGEIVVFASGTSARPFPPATKRPPGRTVALVAQPDGSGYWTVSSTGRVTAFGSARSFGSVGRRNLSGRIVSIAMPPGGDGYWLLSSTGHVYGFGAARSLGSLASTTAKGHVPIRGRVVGLAAASEGHGYWIVTATAQVVAFGTARRLRLPTGATGRPLLPGHVDVTAVGAVPGSPGFWLATASGVVHGFGAAVVPGSAVRPPGAPVGVAAAPDGDGYWLLTASGRIASYGSARPVEVVSGVAPTSGARALASGS